MQGSAAPDVPCPVWQAGAQERTCGIAEDTHKRATLADVAERRGVTARERCLGAGAEGSAEPRRRQTHMHGHVRNAESVTGARCVAQQLDRS